MGAVPGRSLQRESKSSTQQCGRCFGNLWARGDWNMNDMLIGLWELLKGQRRRTRNPNCPRGCNRRARGKPIYI
eukprot:2565649-Pyramimonas_sp.AAC.1